MFPLRLQLAYKAFIKDGDLSGDSFKLKETVKKQGFEEEKAWEITDAFLLHRFEKLTNRGGLGDALFWRTDPVIEMAQLYSSVENNESFAFAPLAANFFDGLLRRATQDPEFLNDYKNFNSFDTLCVWGLSNLKKCAAALNNNSQTQELIVNLFALNALYQKHIKMDERPIQDGNLAQWQAALKTLIETQPTAFLAVIKPSGSNTGAIEAIQFLVENLDGVEGDAKSAYINFFQKIFEGGEDLYTHDYFEAAKSGLEYLAYQ